LPDPDLAKRSPRRRAHRRRFVNAESGAHTHPAMHAKVLERFLVALGHTHGCRCWRAKLTDEEPG
jgi:hypothetical protein